MAITVHAFDWPDRLVIGTIGYPGSRTFYLQARQGDRLMTVGLEKSQAEALAERVDEVLDELMGANGNPFSIPAVTPDGLVDNDPLDEPVREMYRTGVLGVGWEPSTAQIVIEAYSLLVMIDDEIELADIEPEPEDVMSIRLPVGSARAFAKRAREIVGAGRPLCSLCREPMDDDDKHICTLPDGFR